ncbi:hypothetical protein NA56DRAFT_696800 [Hyaloscypha hepaticicola]|uniref:Uncharacterized protein n=1 Tax=Hyaloscypha hepaticicola TaxID=2082293 RepID=A0A2J6QNE2_9HELO|nr:hypothetical protein NA56DRAFT_696800 [Hyaloscypha hepaticicola]
MLCFSRITSLSVVSDSRTPYGKLLSPDIFWGAIGESLFTSPREPLIPRIRRELAKTSSKPSRSVTKTSEVTSHTSPPPIVWLVPRFGHQCPSSPVRNVPTANALIFVQPWKSDPTNHLTCCAPAANRHFIAFEKAKAWLAAWVCSYVIGADPGHNENG